MKSYFGLLILLVIAPPSIFAQNVNPARMYEQQRGTQSPVEGGWHVYDRQGRLLREENYHNYRLDGEMKIFYPSGAIKEVLHYSDGLRAGDDKSYYENGGLESEQTYVDNDLEGPGVHYYDTGEVKSHEHYNKGKLDGEKTIFYKSGIIKQVLYYQNGLMEGAAVAYGEDGQVIADEHYTSGNLVGHHEYGDKTSYVAKNNSASNTAPPTQSSAPASADMPSKLGDSTYEHP